MLLSSDVRNSHEPNIMYYRRVLYPVSQTDAFPMQSYMAAVEVHLSGSVFACFFRPEVMIFVISPTRRWWYFVVIISGYHSESRENGFRGDEQFKRFSASNLYNKKGFITAVISPDRTIHQYNIFEVIISKINRY